MRKMVNGGIVVIITIALMSSSVIAGDFSFPWGNNPQTPVAQAVFTGKKNDPPAHAPAYGHRSKRRYQYFPSAAVYHDGERGLYFYLRGSEWRIAVSLPADLRNRLGDFVTIEMDSDKPYIYNDQHKKQYSPEPVQKVKEKKGSRWAKK